VGRVSIRAAKEGRYGQNCAGSQCQWTKTQSDRKGKFAADAPENDQQGKPAGGPDGRSVQVDQHLVQVDHCSVQVDRSLVQVDQRLVQVDRSLVQVDRSLVQVDRSSVQVDQRLVQVDHCSVQVDGRVVYPKNIKKTENCHDNQPKKNWFDHIR
jgi:hypothetical protein